MKKFLHTLLTGLLLLLTCTLLAQPCESITPKFTADLRGNPGGSWVSPSISRDGYCCTASGSEVCIEFTVLLDSLADGISFNIASGAVPPGALYYQINCGPPILVGQPICLSGTGPHLLTFCKPGNNPNSYSITSTQKPYTGISVSDKASPKCPAVISTFGYVESSVTWSSIPSQAMFESYLNCNSGCDSVTVTPSAGFPLFVDYVVCGNPIGGCGNGIVCDTVRVSFINDLTVTVSPSNILLCNGVGTTPVTTSVSGGSGSYQYSWSSGQTSPGVTIGAGTYSVTVTDTAVCAAATQTVTVNVLPPIVANAGPDISVCANQPSVNLNGSILVATAAIWTGGSGVFSPNNSALNAVYTPSVSEITNGFVNLVLQTTANQGCPAAFDTLRIIINQPPSPSITGTVLLCESTSANYSASLVPGHTYSWTVTGGSVIGSATGNSINVIWGHAGTGSVTVTQTNSSGCSSTVSIPVSIIGLPNPNVTGASDLCQYETTTYQVNSSSGSTYQWLVSGGGMIGSSSSPSISVSWNMSGNGSVTLVETNSYGCTKSYILPVSIKQRPIPVITGNHSACLSGKNSTYSSPFLTNTTYNWSVSGGNIVSQNGSNSIDVQWAGSGVNAVTLRVINSLTGCDSTINFPVSVTSLSKPVVSAGSMSGCPPLSVGFNGNNPQAGQTYEWIFGDQYYSTASNPVHVYEQPGMFSVMLITRSEAGCADTAIGTVHVYDKPISSFTHNCETSNYMVGESTLKITNNSKGGSRYLWTFGTEDTAMIFEPQYSYSKPGDYIIELFAINDYGCKDVSFGLVRARTKERIYVPNAFSPNADNINDYFSIESENISTMKVIIFNRWGDVYFTSSDKEFKWDGTYRGEPVELGIYGYMIKAKGDNGSDYEMNGTLTLVR